MIDMITSVSFQIHGGEMGGGIAGVLAAVLEFLEGLAGKTPPEMFAAIMPGIAAMENVHPLFVHFPVAFFTAFLVFELAGTFFRKPQWRYLASWLLYLGTFFAALTVMAGFHAAETVEHSEDVHEIMERHEHIGISVLSLGLVLSAWRLMQWGKNSTGAKTIFLLLSGLLCLLLSLGADLGGLMVYHYGVSVNPAAVATNAEEQAVNAHAVDSGHESEEPSHEGHHHHHSH